MALRLKRVLILDGVDKVCENILTKAGMEVTVQAKLTKEDLIREMGNHDALIVRSATKITGDILQSSKRLKIIGRAGTGVDNIDVEAATRKGVLVMNTPGGNTLSAAEHTCSMICALSRSIPQACATLKEGSWDRKKFMGNELNEKVLAIVGLGRIGKEVSDRMKSFGMRVIGYDPIVSPETAAEWGIEYLSLEEIWPLADYITVHTPLIPQTKYLINEKVLKTCKPTVRIVNVARGGIVEEAALLKGLNEGFCGGAALDVFEEEPPKDLTLLKHPKVICTPHLGANTYEAQTRVAVEIAEQLVSMSEGKQVIGLVNGLALVEAASPIVQPWIKLASSLGNIASKLTDGAQSVKLSLNIFGGDISKYSKALTPAVLKGYLQAVHPEVNLVNAATLSKEANVEITSTSHKETKENFLGVSNSVDLVIKSGSLNFSLHGSTSEGKPLLLDINNCKFSSGVMLNSNLIFFQSSNAKKTFSSVATGLHSVSLAALFSSTKSGKHAWVVAKTEERIEKVPNAENTDLVFQVSF